MAAFSVRCRHSMRPLAVGWWGVILQRWIPHIFARLWKTDSNWRPWLVMIVCGQPKRDIHPERRAHAAISAVMSGIGKASGQRVKSSTAVIQYWNPAEDSRGPTRSMWMCRKRAGGREKLPTGLVVWWETLERWQGRQARAQVWQSSEWLATWSVGRWA